MPVNGKQKGSAFEREICQALSLWLSAGRDKDLFWRSAMSGGRATVGFNRGDVLSRQAGDICAVHPDGHQLTDRFYLECKFYKDLDLRAFLVGRGKLASFWGETQTQARKYRKRPLLIAKQNNFPTMVLVRAGSTFGGTWGAWSSASTVMSGVSIVWFEDFLKAPVKHVIP